MKNYNLYVSFSYFFLLFYVNLSLQTIKYLWNFRLDAVFEFAFSLLLIKCK